MFNHYSNIATVNNSGANYEQQSQNVKDSNDHKKQNMLSKLTVWSYSIQVEFISSSKDRLISAGLFRLFDELIVSDMECIRDYVSNNVTIEGKASNGENLLYDNKAVFDEQRTIPKPYTPLSSWSNLDIWKITNCSYQLSIYSRTSTEIAKTLKLLSKLPSEVQRLISLKGFMNEVENESNYIICFAFGDGHELQIVSSLDDPRQSDLWKRCDDNLIDLSTQAFLCTAETDSPVIWGKIVTHAMQIASVNSDSQKHKSLYEEVTNSNGIDRALHSLNEMTFELPVFFVLKKDSRSIFKKTLLNLLDNLQKADQSEIEAEFYDIIFENDDKCVMEQWIYNEDQNVFDIYRSDI